MSRLERAAPLRPCSLANTSLLQMQELWRSTCKDNRLRVTKNPLDKAQADRVQRGPVAIDIRMNAKNAFILNGHSVEAE